MRMTPENKHKARAALVDAAGKLFREQGVAATGIDAIARETGQTSGAFYAHFPSKADVFRDAVEAGFARLIGGIKRTGEGGRGARWAGQFAQALPLACPKRCRRPGLSAADARQRCRALDQAKRIGCSARCSATAAAELAKGCGELGRERGEDRAFAILALCAGGHAGRAIPVGAAACSACRKPRRNHRRQDAAFRAREAAKPHSRRSASYRSQHRDSGFASFARAPE